jgi:hypothetical protein
LRAHHQLGSATEVGPRLRSVRWRRPVRTPARCGRHDHLEDGVTSLIRPYERALLDLGDQSPIGAKDERCSVERTTKADLPVVRIWINEVKPRQRTPGDRYAPDQRHVRMFWRRTLPQPAAATFTPSWPGHVSAEGWVSPQTQERT